MGLTLFFFGDEAFMLNIKRKKILISTLIAITLLLTISTSYAGNFTDLQNNITNTATGETLTLNDNYTDEEGIEINITNNITIDGQGHTINFNKQNINNTDPVVISSGNVTLKNIILINARGAIRNNGTLTIENSTFIDNIELLGGAIYNLDGNITILNSTFTNNIAKDGGGAIYNSDGGNITILNSIFTNNTSGKDGGPICNDGNLNISQSIINNSQSIINNNTGDYYIYNKEGGNVTANGNWWGNNTPIFTNLVNFVVDDYYLLKLNTNKLNIMVDELVNLSIVPVLNNTDSVVWSGPEIDIGAVTFTSNSSNAVIDPIGKNNATFKASDSGTYTVTATPTSTLISSISTEITAVWGFENLNQEIQNNITANNTEMNLTQNYIDTTGFTIIITKSIIINGQGHIINFNKQTTTNHIIINNGATVTLKNIIFQNAASSEEDSGVIYNNGTLTIENSTFTNNTADFAGVIYNEGNLRIVDSIFTDNAARIGGAIVNGGDLSIVASEFINNTASNGGGAIYDCGNLSIIDSDFTDNSAGTGGAIDNSWGNLIIQDSTFTNNNASMNGGAIFNMDSLFIKDSIFKNNTAYNMGEDMESYGGAIYNQNIFSFSSEGDLIMETLGNITIINSSFINNTASEYGGAIENNHGILIIRDSTFTNNTASRIGGAIENNHGILIIRDSTFTNNMADYGGAIYSDGGNLSINDSDFTNNTASSSGGAVCIIFGNATIIDSTFTNNTAYRGGAINKEETFDLGFADYIQIINISTSSFTNNTADYGGVISNGGDCEFSIIASNFTNNNASMNGGAIFNRDSLFIKDSTFKNNTAYNEDEEGNLQGNGGAIYNQNIYLHSSEGDLIIGTLGNITISNSSFMDNTAVNAGVIFNSGGQITINSSSFTNNIAIGESTMDVIRGNGGVIFSEDVIQTDWESDIVVKANIIISDSSFTGNNANVSSGAIFNNASLTLNNVNFTNNTATYEEGAIINFKELNIYNSIFTNNSASVAGAILNRGNLTIYGSTFTNNNATMNGGAISNFGGNLGIENSTFKNNTVYTGDGEGNLGGQGGAIYNNIFFDVDYNEVIGYLTIDSSSFINNSAYEGGAIYNQGNLLLFGSEFINNTATAGYGGAIFNARDLTIIGSEFTNNTADEGGAIFNAGVLNMVGSEFTNNTADEGGAILNVHVLTINNSTFINNTANNGGVIYNWANLLLFGSEFINNTATAGYGGAILNVRDLTIIGSSFINNTAKNGGAISNKNGWIYNDDGSNDIEEIISNLTIINSIFNDNVATDGYGGAIINNGNLNITASTFTNNAATSNGGAIYNENITEEALDDNNPIGNITHIGNLTISNSIFKDNVATINGGAIFNAGNLSVSQSVLVDNIGNYMIYNNESVVCADGNWWGNDTPVFVSLVNFDVEDYYVHKLNASKTSIYPNDVVILSLVPVLNGTDEANWMGPSTVTGDVVVSSTPRASIIKKDNFTFIFSGSVGTYRINANSDYITPQTVTIKVIKATKSSVITVSAPSTVIYGNKFILTVKLTSMGKIVAGQRIYVLYRGRTQAYATTNAQGIATLRMPKLTSDRSFTIQYRGNSNYLAAKSVVKKVRLTPLKVLSTTPRNGYKGYSRTSIIVITFNQKIRKYNSRYYAKIYVKNLKNKRKMAITKRISGNKLIIKMKSRRSTRTYYQVYIPRYGVVDYKKKTFSRASSIKFRT